MVFIIKFLNPAEQKLKANRKYCQYHLIVLKAIFKEKNQYKNLISQETHIVNNLVCFCGRHPPSQPGLKSVSHF